MTYSASLILKCHKKKRWGKNNINKVFCFLYKRNFTKEFVSIKYFCRGVLGSFSDFLKKTHFTKAVFSHGKWLQLSFPEWQYVIPHMQARAGDSHVCLDIYGIIYNYSIMVRNILTSLFRYSSTGPRQLTNDKLELVCAYT